MVKSPIRFVTVVGVCFFCFFWTAATQAELPLIRFDRLVPIGASAGTTVQVEQAGGDTDGVTELLFDHPGIKSEHVKDNRVFKLTIAGDVPAGTYDCRLVGRFGVSNPRCSAPSPRHPATRESPETTEDY